MPGGPPADARPIFKTGKYLGCTVCKLAVEEIWKEALRLREEAPYKKPSEDMYQDSIQQICDPIKDLGEWVAMYDITQSERGAPLRMEKQEYMCECRRECRSLRRRRQRGDAAAHRTARGRLRWPACVAGAGDGARGRRLQKPPLIANYRAPPTDLPLISR